MISFEELVDFGFKGYCHGTNPFSNGTNVSPFYIQVFEYDSSTNLFLARGLDLNGISEITGLIKFEGLFISFTKSYNDPNIVFPFLNKIDYVGKISEENGDIILQGESTPVDDTGSQTGFWRLHSQPYHYDFAVDLSLSSSIPHQ